MYACLDALGVFGVLHVSGVLKWLDTRGTKDTQAPRTPRHQGHPGTIHPGTKDTQAPKDTQASRAYQASYRALALRGGQRALDVWDSSSLCGVLPTLSLFLELGKGSGTEP